MVRQQKALNVYKLPPGKDRADLLLYIRRQFSNGFKKIVYEREGRRNLIVFETPEIAHEVLQFIRNNTGMGVEFARDDPADFSKLLNPVKACSVIRISPSGTLLSPSELEKIMQNYEGFQQFLMVEDDLTELTVDGRLHKAPGSGRKNASRIEVAPYIVFQNPSDAEKALKDVLDFTNIPANFALNPDRIQSQKSLNPLAKQFSSSQHPKPHNSAHRSPPDPSVYIRSEPRPVGSTTSGNGPWAIFVSDAKKVKFNLKTYFAALAGFEKLAIFDEGFYIWFSSQKLAMSAVSTIASEKELSATVIEKPKPRDRFFQSHQPEHPTSSLFIRNVPGLSRELLQLVIESYPGHVLVGGVPDYIIVDFIDPDAARAALNDLRTLTNIRVDYSNKSARSLDSQMKDNDDVLSDNGVNDGSNPRTIYVGNLGNKDKTDILQFVTKLNGFVRCQFGQANFRLVMVNGDFAKEAMEKIKFLSRTMKASFARKEPEQKVIEELGDPSKVLWTSTLYWNETEFIKLLGTMDGFERLDFDAAHSWVHFTDIDSAHKALTFFNANTNLYSVFSSKKFATETARTNPTPDPRLAWESVDSHPVAQHGSPKMFNEFVDGSQYNTNSTSYFPLPQAPSFPHAVPIINPATQKQQFPVFVPQSTQITQNQTFANTNEIYASRTEFNENTNEVSGLVLETQTSQAELFPKPRSDIVPSDPVKLRTNVVQILNSVVTDPQELYQIFTTHSHLVEMHVQNRGFFSIFCRFADTTSAEEFYSNSMLRQLLGREWGGVGMKYSSKSEVPIEWSNLVIEESFAISPIQTVSQTNKAATLTTDISFQSEGNTTNDDVAQSVDPWSYAPNPTQTQTISELNTQPVISPVANTPSKDDNDTWNSVKGVASNPSDINARFRSHLLRNTHIDTSKVNSTKTNVENLDSAETPVTPAIFRDWEAPKFDGPWGDQGDGDEMPPLPKTIPSNRTKAQKLEMMRENQLHSPRWNSPYSSAASSRSSLRNLPNPQAPTLKAETDTNQDAGQEIKLQARSDLHLTIPQQAAFSLENHAPTSSQLFEIPSEIEVAQETLGLRTELQDSKLSLERVESFLSSTLTKICEIFSVDSIEHVYSQFKESIDEDLLTNADSRSAIEQRILLLSSISAGMAKEVVRVKKERSSAETAQSTTYVSPENTPVPTPERKEKASLAAFTVPALPSDLPSESRSTTIVDSLIDVPYTLNHKLYDSPPTQHLTLEKMEFDDARSGSSSSSLSPLASGRKLLRRSSESFKTTTVPISKARRLRQRSSETSFPKLDSIKENESTSAQPIRSNSEDIRTLRKPPSTTALTLTAAAVIGAMYVARRWSSS
ncbi:hypothetical protein HK098_005305 [Nowakowskiella sp. JEL0407]|nr:hypothetical protein HK098_005305 [Nowakowskiella sp. JEL0407]